MYQLAGLDIRPSKRLGLWLWDISQELMKAWSKESEASNSIFPPQNFLVWKQLASPLRTRTQTLRIWLPDKMKTFFNFVTWYLWMEKNRLSFSSMEVMRSDAIDSNCSSLCADLPPLHSTKYAHLRYLTGDCFHGVFRSLVPFW